MKKIAVLSLLLVMIAGCAAEGAIKIDNPSSANATTTSYSA